MQCLAQLLQFAVGQIAPLPARNAGQLQRSYARAHQLEDRIADLFKHAPHDAIAALVQHDAHERAILPVAQGPDDRRRGALAVHDDAASQALQRGGGRVAVQQHFVLFFKFEAWVHDAKCDFAVVGKEQQALGGPIEAPHGHDTLRNGHQFHDRAAVAFVRRGCDVAGGLVEHDVAASGVRDQLAVDFDLLGFGVNLRAEFGDDATIDAHAPVDNHCFSTPARGDATRGQDALQTFHLSEATFRA
jgi:hypothetical protein